jgi:hypothetical protein
MKRSSIIQKESGRSKSRRSDKKKSKAIKIMKGKSKESLATLNSPKWEGVESKNFDLDSISEEA